MSDHFHSVWIIRRKDHVFIVIVIVFYMFTITDSINQRHKYVLTACIIRNDQGEVWGKL